MIFVVWIDETESNQLAYRVGYRDDETTFEQHIDINDPECFEKIESIILEKKMVHPGNNREQQSLQYLQQLSDFLGASKDYKWKIFLRIGGTALEISERGMLTTIYCSPNHMNREGAYPAQWCYEIKCTTLNYPKKVIPVTYEEAFESVIEHLEFFQGYRWVIE